MQGLVNRAVERFVRDTYGRSTWLAIMRELDLGFSEFEAMLTYDPALTPRLLTAVAAALERPEADILEDIGTYLVSHPNVAAVRRLLRFGGDTFEDLLYSLEDLPGRAALAVPDLHLPPMDVADEGGGLFHLSIGSKDSPGHGFGHLAVGLFRAMADDYGALVVLQHTGTHAGVEQVEIEFLSADHAEGRGFSLGAVG
jgi:hypothetical protein